MASTENDATIYHESASSSVPGNASMDVSQAEVGFVVGSRPKFADETAALLRARLQAAALALTVILAVAFAGNLAGGTFSFWWLRITILLALAVCWTVLRSPRSLSLTQSANDRTHCLWSWSSCRSRS